MRAGLLNDTSRRLARNGRHLTFQVAHSGLAGIAGDNLAHDRLRDFKLFGQQTVLPQHFRQDVAHPDVDFLLQHIARKLDHIHAVQQRTRDLIAHIGGADEKHMREVKRHFQVVIGKSVVLFRVKCLQQGRRWIAPFG